MSEHARHGKDSAQEGSSPAAEQEVAPAERAFQLPAGLRQYYGIDAAPIQAAGLSVREAPVPAPTPEVTGGAPLHEPVQSKMESSFGSDFSQVRVHEDDRASQVGAQAYTQGNNIHFAPGQYSPGSETGQQLIGHELTHVVQQRAGRVTAQGKGGPINAEAGLESEADRIGDAAARGERVQVSGATSGATGAAASLAVQRKLTIGTKDKKHVYQEHEFEQLWEEVEPKLGLWSEPHALVAKAILQNWIGKYGPISVGVRLTSGVDRQYDSIDEMARALAGEVRSQENLFKETRLAEMLNDKSNPDNQRIVANLQSLMKKIHEHVEAQQQKVALWKEIQGAYRGLWTWMGGPWKWAFDPTRMKFWTVKDVMLEPYDNIKANFNCIKMATNVIAKRVDPTMHVPKGPDFRDTMTVEEKRHTTMSLYEENAWTVTARAYDIPVTAGASGSMNRMYYLAQMVHATAEELVALAWAGHVVFNQSYTAFGNDPHRLHEIMDPLPHHLREKQRENPALRDFQLLEYNASRYAQLIEDTMREGIRWPKRGEDRPPPVQEGAGVGAEMAAASSSSASSPPRTEQRSH
jgi:hypothetical protein